MTTVLEAVNFSTVLCVSSLLSYGDQSRTVGVIRRVSSDFRVQVAVESEGSELQQRIRLEIPRDDRRQPTGLPLHRTECLNGSRHEHPGASQIFRMCGKPLWKKLQYPSQQVLDLWFRNSVVPQQRSGGERHGEAGARSG